MRSMGDMRTRRAGRRCIRAAGVALLVLILAGCATSATHRGGIEFSRMRLHTAVSQPPQPATAPDVIYPEVLLAQGIEGTAEVSFLVDIFGSTEDVKVVSASHPEFGEAAAAAIRRLRYVPARDGTRRVPCAVSLTIFFQIE